MDDDGIDDDTGNNFGLDDFGADADYEEDRMSARVTCLRFIGMWRKVNPFTVTPQRTKTINVIVEWFVKDEPRRISMQVIRMKEE